MKKGITFIILSVITISIFSQEGKVKWYKIEEAEKLMKTDPRPLFIDTYTDWCVWCKKMDNETFTHPVVADLLNTKYYPVKFNAEGKEKVSVFGQTFINDGKAGNAHQLAVALLQGQLSYPTIVFLYEKDGKIGVNPLPGFKQPKELEIFLTFFADKNFETRKWEDFQKNFKSKIQ